MNLAPPSIKFSIIAEDGSFNHTWQRWISDLYEKIKDIEKKIDDLKKTVDTYISTHP